MIIVRSGDTPVTDTLPDGSVVTLRHGRGGDGDRCRRGDRVVVASGARDHETGAGDQGGEPGRPVWTAGGGAHVGHDRRDAVMTDVQRGDEPVDPARTLLDACRELAPEWLRRVTIDAGARGGLDLTADDPELAGVVEAARARLISDLEELLAADPKSGDVKLHFYTFGGLLATSTWAREFVAAQSSGARR